MAEFYINCPHCGTELVADEAWVGMELECPQCKRKFPVPPKPAPTVPKLTLPRGQRRRHPAPSAAPTGGGSAAGNVPPSQPSARNQKNDPNNSSDCLFAFIGLGVIGLLLWLLWLFATGMPRLAFWLIVPIFWIVYMVAGGLKRKFLAILLLLGTVAWGWWAHGSGTASITVKLNLHDVHNNKIERHYSVHFVADDKSVDEADKLYQKLLKVSNGVHDPALCKDYLLFLEIKQVLCDLSYLAFSTKSICGFMNPGETKTFPLENGKRYFVYIQVDDIEKTDKLRLEGRCFKFLQAKGENETLEITNDDLWLLYL